MALIAAAIWVLLRWRRRRSEPLGLIPPTGGNSLKRKIPFMYRYPSDKPRGGPGGHHVLSEMSGEPARAEMESPEKAQEVESPVFQRQRTYELDSEPVRSSP